MKRRNFNHNDINRAILLGAVLCIVVLFAYALFNYSSFSDDIKTVVVAVRPMVIGCVIAFLLNPIMNFFKSFLFDINAKLFKKKSPDSIYKLSNVEALICTIIVFVALVVSFFLIIIPALKDSMTKLYDSTPEYIEVVTKWAKTILKNSPKLADFVIAYMDDFQKNIAEIIKDKVLPNMDTVISTVTEGIASGVSAVLEVVIGIFASIYILAAKDTLGAQFKKLIYAVFKQEKGNVVMDALGYVNQVFGGFINGKIIDSMIIGIICAIFCNIVGMPYAALVSVVVGITNIIPVFGPFIGAIPSALIILVDNPKMCFVFIVFIIILQQIDGNIIGPLILGDSTGLSGFWVLFAIIIGGRLFGIVGMVIGVPVFACIYALAAHFIKKRMGEIGMENDTDYYVTLHKFDEDGNPVRRNKHKTEGRKSKKSGKMEEFTMKQREKIISKMEHANEYAHSDFDKIHNDKKSEQSDITDKKDNVDKNNKKNQNDENDQNIKDE